MTNNTSKEMPTEIGIEEGQNIDKQAIEQSNKKYLIIAVVVGIIIIALIVAATIFLVNPKNEALTQQLRDVFIIFMALTSLVLGIALVILIVQLAVLINLLQNEIRPILDSTNETVNTLKGTTQFISNNLTEPIIKLNQYLAMFKRLIKPSRD